MMLAGYDFCKASNHCHANATCLNLRTTYVCQCKEGFIGDGNNCAGDTHITLVLAPTVLVTHTYNIGVGTNCAGDTHITLVLAPTVLVTHTYNIGVGTNCAGDTHISLVLAPTVLVTHT